MLDLMGDFFASRMRGMFHSPMMMFSIQYRMTIWARFQLMKRTPMRGMTFAMRMRGRVSLWLLVGCVVDVF